MPPACAGRREWDRPEATFTRATAFDLDASTPAIRAGRRNTGRHRTKRARHWSLQPHASQAEPTHRD